MTMPTVTCTHCQRTRYCMTNIRSVNPSEAAKKWLRSTCAHPLPTGKPCVFEYRTGVELPNARPPVVGLDEGGKGSGG